jgi:uncharacterized protein YbcI
MSQAFPSASDAPLKGGELNAALTSAIVGIHTKHLGRGPSSASAFHNDNVVAVLMRDVMTQVEKTISLSGNGHAVGSMRQLFQEAMRGEFTEAVERLTGRKVVAFISGNHVDPDIAVEMFILDAPPVKRDIRPLTEPVAGEQHA